MVEIDSVEPEIEAIKGGAETAVELETALQNFAAADTDVMSAAESYARHSRWRLPGS